MNSFLVRLDWYRTRLSVMSPAEVIHRVIEAGKKWSGRRFDRGWNTFPATGTLMAIRKIADLIRAIDSDLAAVVAREASYVRAGQFHLLGVRWPHSLAMPPLSNFWHIDPGTNAIRTIRNVYCFSVAFRHGVKAPELKRIWEINRLQFLVPLAIDAMVRKDVASRDLVWGFVSSWMDGNPPYRGVNWLSPIELALRVISVALAFSIVGIDHLSEIEKARLSQFFAAHTFWIARYPSLYSSANNHFIAELAGLVIASSFAPEISNTDSLKRRGLETLINEITRQILPDGVGAEQAPSYSAFTMELVLLALLVANRPAEELPNEVLARMAAWANHMRWMMDTSGRVPAIGDCDDCRVISLTQGPEDRYVASIIAAVSGYLGRNDLGPPSREPHLRDLLFRSLNTTGSLAGMQTWQQGGYSVIRMRPSRSPVLIIDHGPIGYLSIAAHGHADTLAFWLSVGERSIIVDAGTYLYHSNATWRSRMRCSPVHNTLTIAGETSSQPAGPFNWATKANAHLIFATASPHPRIVAEHDGYLARFGVHHRRTVECGNDEVIVVTDELVGLPVDNLVAVSFLIDPSFWATLDRESITVLVAGAEGNLLRITGNGSLQPRIVRGDEASGLGWVSPSFGVRVPADQILFEGRLDRPSVVRIELL